MGRHRRSWAFALLLGTVALLGHQPDGFGEDKKREAALDDKEFEVFVATMSEALQKDLAGKPSPEAVQRAGTTAAVIVALAQMDTDANNAKRRIPVRDAARQIAESIQQGKLDDATKQARLLPEVKADANAKPGNLPLLSKTFTFRDAMRHFHFKSKGGNDGERTLLAVERKLGPKGTEIAKAQRTDELWQIAVQASVLGDMCQEFQGAKPKRDPMAWKKWSAETRQRRRFGAGPWGQRRQDRGKRVAPA